MTRYLSLIMSVFFLIFASCEDREKGNTNDAGNALESVSEIDTLLSKPQRNEKNDKKENEIFSDESRISQEDLIPFLTEYGKENPENKVRITTRFGDIEVLLYNDTPLHRANFIFLTKQGYFDGTYFHRVAEGFVVQGGNSDNPETSRKRNNIGSFLIPSEFEAGHRHTRGAFSAAKYSQQNVSKASSPYEFFIVQSPNGAHHLDNDHTVFGRVTKGMDVVDEINKQEVGEGEWPLLNIPIKVEIIE